MMPPSIMIYTMLEEAADSLEEAMLEMRNDYEKSKDISTALDLVRGVMEEMEDEIDE